MCGISGLMNCGDRETLARMTRVQAHRGPDDSGLWDRHLPNGEFVGLGSRRLAILDLSHDGHMPMSNEPGTLWITYNGEIYNFRELREELEAHGCHFHSHTDTEVVLKLYERYGAECLNHLNGMFAFAICDLRDSIPKIFLARDHFGVKPLYYCEKKGGLAFASEIKALLEVPGIDPELDPASLHQYLTFLWVPDPATMFRQIRKLEAGHYAIFRGGELRITKYWDLEFPPSGKSFSIPERDLFDEILVRLEKSVRSQMVSDVPIGAFLSAGLDSSSIVAMMCRNTDRPVRTYTITFPEKYRVGESALDDPAVPAELARQLGCENEQLIVEPDVVNLVPQLTWHMDEPTADPAIIAAYLVCREAKKQATVMLSGVGGDELFAGYRKHAAHYWAQIYRKIPSPLRGLSEAAVLALPGFRGSAFKGTVRLAKKMARSASLSPQEQFIRNCTYLDDGQKSALYGDGLHDALADQDSAERHRAAFDRVQAADFLNQMLYLDTKIFMVSLNLTYNDKMSMASSVEVRVPFLDRSLAEFVSASVPPRLKLQGTWRPTTKYILRRALEGVLPEKVLNQPKAGFAAPIDYWLANDLRPMVDELLSEATVARRGLFKPAEVQRYIAEHRQGAEDWSMQIWQFLTLELWMQVFLDGGWKQMSTESMLAQPLARA
jgi:asparagine synthase (glutamine-hydrolysing)